MKKLLTPIAALGLIGTPVFAADMAVKAPPPPTAPVFSWTGFYGGLNMGVSFGRASADVNYFAPSLGSTVCGPPGALCINGSDTVDMNGPIGGVQAGYNWQNGNYLLGVEADFQGTGQSATRDFAVSFNNGTSAGGVTQGTAGISLTERMPWLGTVRGRVGYVANQWLVYATGGLAYGRIEVDSSASAGAFLTPIGALGTPTCNGPFVPGACRFGALAEAASLRSDGQLVAVQSWLWVATGPRSLSTFLLILDRSTRRSLGYRAALVWLPALAPPATVR
jgi:outer membrane immunogenic protein